MSKPLSRLMLGTAQFGGKYGIANRSGCPSDDEARAILNTAHAAGIRYVDTARAYGDAEERLGRLLGKGVGQWGVVSKLAPLGHFMELTEIADPAAAAERSIADSCAALGIDRIDILMVHRAEDLRRPGVLKALQSLVRKGLIGALGASVYDPHEALRCASIPAIGHLQLPFNLLDSRWPESEVQAAFAGRPDLTIHARSVFLQGLLLNPPSVWPAWATEALAIGSLLDLAAARFEYGRAELCLRYVGGMSWIHTMVVGVDSAEHLRALTRVPLDEPLDGRVVDLIRTAARLASPRLLNPSLW
jgi:spore coat polysaccharide biosynthesis protein SpsF